MRDDSSKMVHGASRKRRLATKVLIVGTVGAAFGALSLWGVNRWLESEQRKSSRPPMSSAIDPDARFPWESGTQVESLVPLDEIVPGGPPPDGIPAIDSPEFEEPSKAGEWLAPNEPVVAVEVGADARGYPLQILMWHEIVNDVVGGQPVAVTYCPLCDSATVYSREIGEITLDFGTSGRLYKSNLVMYDRQTKSLWPQIEGRAVAGRLIGTKLKIVPSVMLSFKEWMAVNPKGKVLSRSTGFSRPYGRNPYVGYDSPSGDPFLYRGIKDPRLPALERVIGLVIGGEARAYPFSALKQVGRGAGARRGWWRGNRGFLRPHDSFCARC